MAKMGKLTPEEETRNKMLMRERDRERKRMKRMNPEYRRMEQERDRDRKKARRANEAFRQLEKLRDKIRKERKKGNIVDDTLTTEFVTMPPVPVEPEIIISDPLPASRNNHQGINTNSNSNNNNRNRGNANTSNVAAASHNSAAVSNSTITTITGITSTGACGGNTTAVSTAAAAHMQQINKSLLYPPPNFPHHPLPIAGVTLMPQLCHPILHQNLGATFYPPNGIKQEYMGPNEAPNSPVSSVGTSASSRSSGGGSNTTTGNSDENNDVSLIEPEIILQTSTDVIAAPHHFHNHAHTHHLHQQQCSMFQHMTPQAHMSHMRAHTHLPLPPASHATQQQQHMQHYTGNKNS